MNLFDFSHFFNNTQYMIIIVSTLIFILMVKYVYNLSKLPPGPWGIPFIGYAFFLDNDHRDKHVSRLCKEYNTDILSLTFFGNQLVILNDYELIKDTFLKRKDVVDRIENDFMGLFDKKYSGVVGTSGKLWRNQRRFALYMLRDMGMGKLASELYIQNEADVLIQRFKAFNGQAFNPQKIVNMAVSNVINCMVFGKRFDYEDAEFNQALNYINGLVRKFANPKIYFLIRFELGKLLVGELYRSMVRDYNGFSDFAQKQIDQHKKTYDGTVHDLIDGYLKEMENEDDERRFSDQTLKGLITDLFIAGSETTFTTLRWALLYIAAYPEVQEKVYQELNEVFNGRTPNMADKKKTPYTEAVINEVQRVTTLLCFGLVHTCLIDDFDIAGYKLDRGTAVMANLHQVHRDPKIWKNPDQFDPNNFLDENGEIAKLDRMVVFAIGRRSCAGEALARMELYIFFASWIQKFRVELATTMTDLTGRNLGVYQPKDFEIRMIER